METNDFRDGKSSSKKTSYNKKSRPKKGGSKNRKYPPRNYKADDLGTEAKEGVNDVSWYAVNDQILKDAASLPFSHQIGVVDFPAEVSSAYPSLSSVPGLCVLDFQPSLGYSFDATSAANMSARAFYAFVRQANSGSSTYETPDLMMYFLGSVGVVEFIAFGERIYGMLGKASNYNKYMGRDLVLCMKADYNDWLSNQANFRLNLNSRIQKFNRAIHIPKNFKLLERGIFRNSNLFADATQPKSTIYAYRQNSWWQYYASALDTGGCVIGNSDWYTGGSTSASDYSDCSLGAYSWPFYRGLQSSTLNTTSDYFTILDELMSALLDDSDVQNVSGDILRAYGSANCFEMPMLTETYETPIVYNESVATQIHNYSSNFVRPGGGEGIYSGYNDESSQPKIAFYVNPLGAYYPNSVVYQKDNIIRCQPVAICAPSSNTSSSSYYSMQRFTKTFLDLPYEHPDPGQVMEATRLLCAPAEDGSETFPGAKSYVSANINLYYYYGGSTYSSGYYSMSPYICGSEAVQPYTMVYGYDQDGYLNSWGVYVGSPYGGIGIVDFTLSPIENHPRQYTYVSSTSSTSITVDPGTPNWDMTNYTVLSDSTLNDIHKTALNALLDVPTFTVSSK